MKSTEKFVVALVMAADKKQGRKIAKELLKGRLAACVNIIDKVESLYVWDGKYEQSAEVLLIIKTRLSLADELTRKIKKLHSYKVPEIIFLPIIAGSREYLSWLASETPPN
jgi:periplasmic divalent cation tolerance protein